MSNLDDLATYVTRRLKLERFNEQANRLADLHQAVEDQDVKFLNCLLAVLKPDATGAGPRADELLSTKRGLHRQHLALIEKGVKDMDEAQASLAALLADLDVIVPPDAMVWPPHTQPAMAETTVLIRYEINGYPAPLVLECLPGVHHVESSAFAPPEGVDLVAYDLTYDPRMAADQIAENLMRILKRVRTGPACVLFFNTAEQDNALRERLLADFARMGLSLEVLQSIKIEQAARVWDLYVTAK